MMVSNAANDIRPLIKELVPYFCQKLDASLNKEIVTSDDKDEQYQLQALLCGTLQTAINHLEEIAPLADSIMQLLLRVFSCRSATAHEEAFMAIGAMANAVEGGFGKYMTAFHPFLKRPRPARGASGLRGRGRRGGRRRPRPRGQCPPPRRHVTLLIRNLQNPKLDRSVKRRSWASSATSPWRSADFEKYPVAMTMLQQAGRIATPDPDDEDMVEYVSTLRRILDAPGHPALATTRRRCCSRTPT